MSHVFRRQQRSADREEKQLTAVPRAQPPQLDPNRGGLIGSALGGLFKGLGETFGGVRTALGQGLEGIGFNDGPDPRATPFEDQPFRPLIGKGDAGTVAEALLGVGAEPTTPSTTTSANQAQTDDTTTMAQLHAESRESKIKVEEIDRFIAGNRTLTP